MQIEKLNFLLQNQYYCTDCSYIIVFIVSTSNSILSCDLILDGYCYQHFSQLRHWTEANSSCAAWGGELVSLYTQTLSDFLAFFISNTTAWTSANNLETDNLTLIWSNGSAVELSSGVNNTKLVCGYLSDSGVFNTSICNISRFYICSKQSEFFLILFACNLTFVFFF